MKLIPRSFWTSYAPNPSYEGENLIGLPFFTKPPKRVVFSTPGDEVLYVYRNPAEELFRLQRRATNRTGVSDIDYNYAIAQNVEGVFVCRGALTKCTNSEDLRVLMLLGKDEKPTDLLRSNQASFQYPPVGNNLVSPVRKEGERNVHVFDLIEWLTEKGYYKARNDGVFGPLVKHAVKLLQLDLDVVNLNGIYDEWTHKALYKEDREYIKINA